MLGSNETQSLYASDPIHRYQPLIALAAGAATTDVNAGGQHNSKVGRMLTRCSYSCYLKLSSTPTCTSWPMGYCKQCCVLHMMLGFSQQHCCTTYSNVARMHMAKLNYYILWEQW